jgi:Ni/Fe-hydrogenase subunit HybB-like protein
MAEYAQRRPQIQSWVRERIFLGLSIKEYVKRLVNPFNVVAGIIILIGLPFVVMRFTQGLGTVTHASQDQPWGLFLSWGLFTGVPLAGAGFVMGSAVYLFGLKEYRPLLRPAVLLGFLGYIFAVLFLLADLGRPWRLPFPMFVSYGVASFLFFVAWSVACHLALYFVEFCPPLFEWLDSRRFRGWALRLTVGATILVVTLSTLHQSALGALFLLSPGKLHPLWYSSLLPVLFFVSSIVAGLSIVIVEGTLVSRFLKHRVDAPYVTSLPGLTLGLGKAASIVLFTYFGLKVIGIALGNHWSLLNTSFGHWFLAEIIIFVLLPCFLFAYGVRNRNVSLIRFTAFFAILSIAINRFNVTLIALNWKLPHREFFHWGELILVITIITVEILIYRWIVNRMPIHREHPDYRGAH